MEDRFALITGSSSGLGFEMAQYLLEENYFVFGASRSGTDIDDEQFVDLAVDVKREESIIEMFEEISAVTPHLDLIVNNAGIFEMGAIEEITSEEFSDHLNTNVLGAFHVLKHSKPYLLENESHIIHIVSIAGKRGFPNIASYSASKFGLNGLIEAAREEFKRSGIRFTTLYPGAIDTPLWDSITEDMDRKKMLSLEEFTYVFDMVVRSPRNIQFPDITFLHRSGVIE